MVLLLAHGVGQGCQRVCEPEQKIRGVESTEETIPRTSEGLTDLAGKYCIVKARYLPGNRRSEIVK
jgi:hypothetical protein